MLGLNRIAWIREESVDTDAIMVIMRLIPRLFGTLVSGPPPERLYDTVLECLDCSAGRHVVIPKLRKKAYLGTKALLYLSIQHKCVGNESDKAVLFCDKRTCRGLELRAGETLAQYNM